ncbi:MAG: hypothetical protein EOP06_10415 [Proteobacteria bacterium]|nr:MAG: hypothetical protein EOP06_10415 [Pseudomonadota bacterium]
MSALANHMRITGLSFTNDDVDSRNAAIKSLRATWGKITAPSNILSKAADVAAALGGDGTPSETLGKEVEVAIQKKASAFLYVDRPFDVGIVAGMVVTDMLSGTPDSSGWLNTDVWASALWSALSFQPPLADTKREGLRVSILQAARDRCVAGAEKARQRVNVPDLGSVSVVVGEEAKIGEAIKTATMPTIEALRRNAALDREEIDFLWWVQLRRSRLLQRSIDSIDEIVRVVAAGIEGAGHLRRFPCEVHREIILRTIDVNPTFTLAEVVAALHLDRQTLAAVYANGLPPGGAILFPLLSSIIAGEATDVAGAELTRSAEDWGGRALLEAALAKFGTTGPSKL